MIKTNLFLQLQRIYDYEINKNLLQLYNLHDFTLDLGSFFSPLITIMSYNHIIEWLTHDMLSEILIINSCSKTPKLFILYLDWKVVFRFPFYFFELIDNSCSFMKLYHKFIAIIKFMLLNSTWFLVLIASREGSSYLDKSIKSQSHKKYFCIWMLYTI